MKDNKKTRKALFTRIGLLAGAGAAVIIPVATMTTANASNRPVVIQETSLTQELEKAKSVALKNAGLTASQVKFTKAVKVLDDGKYEYDIEFCTSNKEYDYEIAAGSYNILEKDVDTIKQVAASKPAASSQSSITLAKAKNIALKNAGLKASQVVFKKAKTDYDDGRKVYEIEFRRGNVEYEYEIAASNGAILDKDIDRDDD